MSRFSLLAAVALLVTGVTPCRAAAQSQLETYTRAVHEYDAGRYAPACTAMHELYTSTNGFASLDAAVVNADKPLGRYLDWQHKAYESDGRHEYAKECVEWLHVGIWWRGGNDMSFVRDAGTYAGRAIEHLAKGHPSAPKTPARVAAPARRPGAVAHGAPAPATPATGTDGLRSGSGKIPDGEYACYSATTARILAGGGARLEPGSWHGVIKIKGDTYVISDNPVGHYSVGSGGRITWKGGAYSAVTLGRYVISHDAPAIVIGWADTDAGLVCTR